jgi:primosomal protein N' (replication factor Y)
MRQVFGHRVFGPDIPFVSRVQMLFIRKVILKIEYNVSQTEVRKRLRQIQKYLLDQPQYKSAQVYYDVDPQ